MAKPIKETPVLEGKDAERFEKAREEAEKSVVNEEEKQRIRENYEKLQAIADFK